jgi:hypothetical protein
VSTKTPAQRVDRVLAEAVGRDLSSWERHEFLPNVRQRNTLTEKQEAVLSKIEDRVIGDDES